MRHNHYGLDIKALKPPLAMERMTGGVPASATLANADFCNKIGHEQT